MSAAGYRNGKYDLNDGGWSHPYPRRPYEVRHSLLVEVGSESGGSSIHPSRQVKGEK